MTAELRTERHDTTLVLTIKDPDRRHPLSDQACSAGVELLNVAEGDAGVRAVVLRGDGSSFCAGDDPARLQRRREEGAEAQRASVDRFHAWIEALAAFPKPVVAAVEGEAADAGFSLALACDLIVAAEDARFLLGAARYGLAPEGGALWHLAQALPRQRLQQLVWLAEPLDARTLASFGLVARITAPGASFAAALELATQLAATCPPSLLAGTKDLLRRGPPASLRDQLAAERERFVDSLFDANGAEGLAAALEKRQPRFR